MPWGWIFAQIIKDRRSTKVAKMMVVHWRLIFLRRGQVCFPVHLYGHHTFVWEKCWEFQTISPLKPLANVVQISCGASLGWGSERLLKWSQSIYQDGCQSSSPEPNKPLGLTFAQILGDRRSNKIAKMMVLHWHLTFLRQGQICFPCICMSPIHLYGKKMLRIHSLDISSIIQLNRNLMMSISALMRHKIAKWADRKIQDGHHSHHLENQFSISLFKP